MNGFCGQAQLTDALLQVAALAVFSSPAPALPCLPPLTRSLCAVSGGGAGGARRLGGRRLRRPLRLPDGGRLSAGLLQRHADRLLPARHSHRGRLLSGTDLSGLLLRQSRRTVGKQESRAEQRLLDRQRNPWPGLRRQQWTAEVWTERLQWRCRDDWIGWQIRSGRQRTRQHGAVPQRRRGHR